MAVVAGGRCIKNLVGVKFDKGQHTRRSPARAPLGFISIVSSNILGPMGWSGFRERLGDWVVIIS